MCSVATVFSLFYDNYHVFLSSNRSNVTVIKSIEMRTKEFLTRLSVLLPLALWSVFTFMILLGIMSNALGVFSGFYCDVYCKLGFGLFTILVLFIVFCQWKSCWK